MLPVLKSPLSTSKSIVPSPLPILQLLQREWLSNSQEPMPSLEVIKVLGYSYSVISVCALDTQGGGRRGIDFDGYHLCIGQSMH
jgi:hypothetical protein